MHTNFPASFFITNRKRLREACQGIIVLTGNGLMQRAGDSNYTFRQDSSFWYLTGLDDPEIVLVIDTDGTEFLVTPERSTTRNVFEGSLDASALSESSGVGEVLDYEQGWDRIHQCLANDAQIAILDAAPLYIAAYGMYTNPARHHLKERLLGLTGGSIEDLRPIVAGMRAVKQPLEIDAIQAAVSVSVTAFEQISAGRKKYTNEYEIEAAITHTFKRDGYDHAYAPIVASGLNACTLHYGANNTQLSKKNLLLIDAGAETPTHYAADITRTYALSAPTKRQQAVHSAVLAVQQEAMSFLKPGVYLKEYEQHVRRHMLEQLIALKLVTAKTKDQARTLYPHATSHFLGLDVHDVGDYDRPLEPGMVLTVEPGIYIPKEGIGIRIEDDVLITETGIKNLSEKLPSGLR